MTTQTLKNFILGDVKVEFKDGKWYKTLVCPHCGGEVKKEAGTFLDVPKRKQAKRVKRDINHVPVGYIYLMKSGNGYYKIGIAKDVEKRKDGLKRQFPVSIQVVHSIASDCYRYVESQLHQRFEDKRVEYEWFSLSQEDVNWIMQFKDYELDVYPFHNSN